MLKLFVTDLDGTLLGNENHILPEDIDAIAGLVDDGVEFAVASGRMDRDILEVFKQVNQTGHRVSQNGSFVYHGKDGLVHTETFPDELSKRLHQAIAKYPTVYSVSTADEVYVAEKTPEIEAFEHLLYFPVKEEKRLEAYYGETVFPAKFTIHGETADILQVKQEITEEFGPVMESYLSDAHCVDFVPKGISKALGLQRLIDKLGVSADEIAVIGDSFNDVPMLEMTPYSYAMSTAHPDVQKTASRVVDHVHQAIRDLKERKVY
ncbi:Cof-type HAD-IIB family hydrolase [Sediminibacillus terrae]|uniref:Cof-type HAD-IIB family hydrolase n=1 Tax=Sediminibacillus terrae TaxID=1562106 RepID=UPI0003F7CC95|nr:Cof-type HAD-IIB family hydrolase [Sediminibacillus terrae]